ncbi:MAG: restriction endonuclease subunit S [Bacteroidales bacterium]|nr:restriction endonuclease subunit S [Bacteroidales bacterium]
MKYCSNKNTKSKTILSEVAEVISGVFLPATPYGDVSYLQIKDLLFESPEKTASKVILSPKNERYSLAKGDLLFAGKGTTYLCKLFDLDIPAIASTTLYIIRLTSKDILPDYLCYYLNQPSVMAMMKAQHVGTSTPLIHKQVVEDFEIPIPDLETQQCIVELAKLQVREKELYQAIAEKRQLITSQLIMNKLE